MSEKSKFEIGQKVLYRPITQPGYVTATVETVYFREEDKPQRYRVVWTGGYSAMVEEKHLEAVK